MVDDPTPGKALSRRELDRWLFGSGHGRRRTQDSPIMPDVWYSYGLAPSMLEEEEVDEPPLIPPSEERAAPQRAERPPNETDLLLRPHAESTAGALAHVLSRRLARPRDKTRLAYNEAYVACRLTFEELLRAVLPLTEFWLRLWPGKSGPLEVLVRPRIREIAPHYEGGPRIQGRKVVRRDDLPGDLVWLLGLVGRIAVARGRGTNAPTARGIVEAALRAFGDVALGGQEDPPVLWAVSRNRTVRTSVYRSRITCKADAATRLFQLSCRDIRWAVIDSGVDARHPAFAARRGEATLSDADTSAASQPADAVQPWNGLDPAQSADSRVIQTWDFAGIRDVLTRLPLDDEPATPASSLDDPVAERIRGTAERVRRGRVVDWDEIAPQLEITHDDGYTPPRDEHGTHVAGILVADWRADDRPTPGPDDVKGVCPDMRIYDLRAFNAAGQSDEFQVLSAMQFVRHLNAHADLPVIHGVNLSFSVRHDVDKYAAGSTPVCDEAHRLVASGVVVVAAAGNDGRGGYTVNGRTVDGYRTVSITDPGNAEKVITVGATHRDRPHEYGVSYFSSRGPTGDGRRKPDLVAPGEKITAPVPDLGLKSKDGTSQATPHVSGACALLMARHPELLGHPDRVKQVLIDSCTDLGRDRLFQGAGLVDILRAIQAV
jgi:serine protease AprX